MELRDLRYFCLAAEMQHFTQAADRLGVAQPFLTKVIKQIEEEVGGELFEKNGRGVKLNACGEVFYKYAKRTLADMDRLYSEMDYVFERKERRVTLLCNTEACFPRLTGEFQKTDASYALTLLHKSKDEMVQALVRGDAEFALCCPPIEADEALNIETQEIFYEIGCVLLPPGHPLIGSGSITLDDLRGEPLITMPPKSGMRYKLDPVLDKYDFHPEIVLETNDINIAIGAVNSGWGYAFLTTLIVDDHPEVADRMVLLDVPEVKGVFGLSYNTLFEKERNFADFKAFIIRFLNGLSEHLYGEDAQSTP